MDFNDEDDEEVVSVFEFDDDAEGDSDFLSFLGSFSFSLSPTFLSDFLLVVWFLFRVSLFLKPFIILETHTELDDIDGTEVIRWCCRK